MVGKAVIAHKIVSIEQHLKRIKELPSISQEDFMKEADVQDILLFNLLQAIQNCIDIATHIVSDEEWGIPGTQREAFEILGEKGTISDGLVERLAAMVGFRNRVIHEYEKLRFDIVYEVWKKGVKDLQEFCSVIMERFV